MRNDHITDILERAPLHGLSPVEKSAVEAHTADCSACRRAYEVAGITTSLIQARASEVVEPSAFFKTRVMAAIREKQLAPEEPALLKMWKAAGALVFSMAALVVVLAGLTVFSPDWQAAQPEVIASSQSLYSAETVLFEPEDGEDGVAYDQALAAMYDLEDSDGE